MIAQFYFSSLQSSGTGFITMATSVRHPAEPAETVPLHKHKNKVSWTLSRPKHPAQVHTEVHPLWGIEMGLSVEFGDKRLIPNYVSIVWTLSAGIIVLWA